ncbi:uncharacterized protein LOC127866048 isoform X12 [Dreissena polymorpha]|uniref:uncharacterized protein LOC127866048 isoform X12 n=1 Tax=Dreissena polymorpha TaxID=45954 RepID=UPI0022648CD7|nr:uncharacterized protein LOC127866048 isoform X12 [Dreissena polymorpha]
MKIVLLVVFIGLSRGAPSADPGPGLCDVCHLLVGEIQEQVQGGQAKDAVRDYVTSICARLPTEQKDGCQWFFRNNAEALFDTIVSELTPSQFCSQIPDVCPVQIEPKQLRTSVEGNPLECELCKLAVLGIDKLVKQNRSSAAINATLEKFCNSLPGELGNLCRKIEPLILQGLTQGFDPKVACKFATLCSDSSPGDISILPCEECHSVIDAIGVSNTEEICGIQATCRGEVEQPKEKSLAPHPETDVKDTVGCQICKFVVLAADNLLGENKTAAAVKSTLDKLCNDLPGELKDTCLNAEPDIMKAILSGVDPTKACDFVKICNDGQYVPVSSQYIPCQVCQEVLQDVAGKHAVELCRTLISGCAVEEVSLPVNTPTCEICQFIFKGVTDLLPGERTSASVMETMDSVCANLPDQGRIVCSKYEEKIVRLIIDGMADPMQGCKLLAVCQGHEKEIASQPAHSEHMGDATCEMCTFTTELLREVIAGKSDVAIIKSYLNTICEKLPISYQDVCHRLALRVDTSIEASLVPYALCKEVQLCTGPAILSRPDEVMCKTCAEFVEILPSKSTASLKDNVCSKVCPRRSRRSVHEMTMADPEHNLNNVASCDLCKIAIKTLDGVAGENKSIAEITKTATEVCTRLTGMQLQEICLKSLPTLVHLMENGVNAEAFCKKIKLCTEDTVKSEPGKKIVKRAVPVNGIECDICEGITKILDKVIEKNATVQIVNETIYKICDSLPAGELQEFCLQEAPVIVSFFQQGFDPKETCSLAKFCSDKEHTITLTRKHVGDIKCDICELIIQELDQVVGQNASAEKINATIYALCDKLPGAAKTFCQLVAPTVIKEIEQGADPQKACAQLKLCSSDISLKPENPKPVGDIKCDICELIIQELDQVVGQNASAEKINATIYALCDKLPGTSKTFCQLVAPSVIKEIKQGADPQKACEQLKLCSSDQTIKLASTRPVGDLKCDICELIIQELDQLVGQNASAEKINSTIYALCDKLPGTAKTFCQLVAPTVVKEVEQGADPQKACTQLKLCSSEHVLKLKSPKQLGDIKCDICELIIQELDKLVGQNASAEKINSTIYALCDKLPGTAKTFCQLVAPTVVKEVEQGADPQKACAQLKLCSSEHVLKLKSPKQLGDIKCDICELIIQELDKLVGQNASAEKINSTIYALCDKLPGTAKTFCQLVAPTVVKEVEQGADPQKACAQLKLCSSEHVLKLESPKQLGDIKCDICELIIQELDKLVGQNASAEKINSTIYALCDKLPGTAKTFCQLVVPTVVKEVEQGADQQKACAQLKLCSSEHVLKLKSPKQLGDIKCDICELIIQELDKLVGQNASAEKINSTIYALCDKLPGTAKTFCQLVAPTVVKEVEQGADPQKACAQLKLCSSEHVLKLKSPKQLGDIKCDICELIIQELDKLVGQNASAEKINSTIYALCDKLPGTAKTFCQLVAPTVVKEVEQGADPQKACTQLKLCSSEHVLKLESSQQLGDIKCDICELIIQELDKLVGQNASAEKINSTIYALCDKLPGTAKTFCQLVAPTVVKEVEQGADPQKACAQLKLCSSEHVLKLKSPKQLGDIKCDICELIIQELDKLVGQNASAEKINSTVYALCDKLPGTAKTFCQLVAPTVVKEVEQGADPQKACAQLKLCSSEASVKVGDIKCDICEFLVHELDAIIGKNASIDKINSTIYGLCQKLSGTAQAFCVLVAPSVLKELEAGADPQKACSAIKLCSAVHIPPPVNDLKCEVCELIILKVDGLVGNNHSDAKINQTVYQVCYDLGGTLQTFCLLIAPTVINELEKGAKPDETCKLLKICPNYNDTVYDNSQEQIRPGHVEAITCDMCATSLQPILHELDSDYLKVNRFAQAMCNNLPVVYRKQCQQLVASDNGKYLKIFLNRFRDTMCEKAHCTGVAHKNLS